MIPNPSFQPPSVQTEVVVCREGLDQITPTLSLAGGVLKFALNFECGVTGGYTRVGGYERFDGQPSPADNSNLFTVIEFDVDYLLDGDGEQILDGDGEPIWQSPTAEPEVGDAIVSSGGAAGVVAYIIDDGRVAVCQVTGTFTAGHTVDYGHGGAALTSADLGPANAKQWAQIKNAVADIYRADITAVPGSGPVRGVVELNDVVYAFRDNVGATAVDVYKSSTSGWTQVPLLFTVSFTGGSTAAPAEGVTLTQGGVTATIRRVCHRTGTFAGGTAVGEMIISAPAGGNFAAGAATYSGGSVTLSGAQTAVTLPAGGTYEFYIHNFAGQAYTTRIYGANGVGKGFEFDGTYLVPITTGAAVDTPTHVCAWNNFLVFAMGSSLMGSVPGQPYNWQGTSGAWEIATGDTVTGIIPMPGGETTPTLGVTSRDNTSILYGSSTSDFKLVQFNTGAGAVPYSLQNMAQTLMFDDRGAVALRATLDYGNFTSSTLTNRILPFVKQKIGKLVASTLCRNKSQYRVFFNDGYGLYISMPNGKLSGCMPVYFPMIVHCAFEGKRQGSDVMYVGATDGFVYQLDKGTSCDGEAMDYLIQLTYASQKSPRVHKRYRKAAVEVYADAASYAEFYFNHILGYASQEYSQSSEFNYNKFFMSDVRGYQKFLQDARWDTLTWDQFFYDISGLAPVECQMDGTAENVAMIFYGSSDYVGEFTINSILLHYSLRRMMR